MTTRPIPVPDERSAPYWDAARRHEPVLPRCSSCGRFDLPPDVVCRRCSSPDPDWSYEPVSGRGRIASWTVVRKSFLPGLEAPFVLVDVHLEDQDDLRMIGRLLDGPDADLRIGARVETVYEDVDDDHAVPAYRLIER